MTKKINKKQKIYGARSSVGQNARVVYSGGPYRGIKQKDKKTKNIWCS